MMGKKLTKKTVAILLCVGMIASIGFVSPASAAVETPPVFDRDDLYYNNYLNFYTGIDESTGLPISPTLKLITNFDSYIQNQSYTCGDVAAMLLENYYTDCGLSEEKVGELETIMNSNADYGTGTEAMKEYFDSIGWFTLMNCFHGTDNFDYNTWPVDGWRSDGAGGWTYTPNEDLLFLKENVEAGIPTLIECMDWGGHWQVVIGYDDNGTSKIEDDVIIMADPGDKTDHNWDGYYIFPAARFQQLWYDDYCLIYHNHGADPFASPDWDYSLATSAFLYRPFVFACPYVVAEVEGSAVGRATVTEESLRAGAKIRLSLLEITGNTFGTPAIENFSLQGAPAGTSITNMEVDGDEVVLTVACSNDIRANCQMEIVVDDDALIQPEPVTMGGIFYSAYYDWIYEITSAEPLTSTHAALTSNIIQVKAASSSNTGSRSGGGTTPPVTEQTVTTVDISSDAVSGQLAANAAEVTISITADTDVVVGQISGDLLADITDKGAALNIETKDARYVLPADTLDMTGTLSQLGPGVTAADVTFKISISNASAADASLVESASNKAGFSVVGNPVTFDITVSAGGKDITVGSFKGYVARYINLSREDAARVSGAVVLQSDGTVRPVPMKLVTEDGKTMAKVSSLTNSTYALISNTTSFSDTENHWAAASINNLSSRLIINGVGENMFKPNNDITRAEFATIIVKALGLEARGGASFTDVKSTDWFSGSVGAASSNGLITGYTDGSFKPNQKITREEAMVILAKAMKITGIDGVMSASEISQQLSVFSDRDSISTWAQSAVASCTKENIATGKTATLMSPKVNVTRAEVCTMVERTLKKSDLI